MTAHPDSAPDLPRYPAADIGHREFEDFVAELFGSVRPLAHGFTVQQHETIKGTSRTHDFDATVRYELGGLEFLVIVEVKRHKNPIKASLVESLHSQAQSVGAHKAVMVSTASFQTGAIAFAKVHRIALITITETRFVYVAKGMAAPRLLAYTDDGDNVEFLHSPEQVAHLFGIS